MSRIRSLHVGMPPGAASVLALLLLLVSCSRHSSTGNDLPGTEPATIDSIARSYVRLALALGERDPDSLDFSIAPAALSAQVHKTYPTLAEISDEATTLSQQLHALATTTPEQHHRAEFLELQLAAIKVRAAMLHGQPLEFDSEALALFDTARLPDTRAAERRMLRGRIAAMLPRALKPGESEADRYAEYNRRFIVPPAKLLPVMNAAIALGRRGTLEHITLPAGESVELKVVRERPWTAFSRYVGHAHSVIVLNLDLPLTVDDALELACHEGYPGHHVFNTLRDLTLVQERHMPEAEVQLTFSPQSYLSEAAAAYAPEMAFTPEERGQVERDVLFPLAELPAKEAERSVKINSLVRPLDSATPAIARKFVDGQMEFVRAEQALASEALMANSEAMLLYLNEYRSYMLAYTDGPQRIAAELDAATAAMHPQPVMAERNARWSAYEQMMRTLKFRLDAPVAAGK